MTSSVFVLAQQGKAINTYCSLAMKRDKRFKFRERSAREKLGRTLKLGQNIVSVQADPVSFVAAQFATLSAAFCTMVSDNPYPPAHFLLTEGARWRYRRYMAFVNSTEKEEHDEELSLNRGLEKLDKLLSSVMNKDRDRDLLLLTWISSGVIQSNVAAYLVKTEDPRITNIKHILEELPIVINAFKDL